MLPNSFMYLLLPYLTESNKHMHKCWLSEKINVRKYTLYITFKSINRFDYRPWFMIPSVKENRRHVATGSVYSGLGYSSHGTCITGILHKILVRLSCSPSSL